MFFLLSSIWLLITLSRVGWCLECMKACLWWIPAHTYYPITYPSSHRIWVLWPTHLPIGHRCIPYCCHKIQLYKHKLTAVCCVGVFQLSASHATPATVQVFTALLGDLCSIDSDCSIPHSICIAGACTCRTNHTQSTDRQHCLGTYSLDRLIFHVINIFGTT